MQAKQRYILVFISCAFLALCYFGGYRLKLNTNALGRPHQPLHLESYLEDEEVLGQRGLLSVSPKQVREETRANVDRTQCRMETCFDFTKCVDTFKVYVYPVDETLPMSSTYRKILNVITESR